MESIRYGQPKDVFLSDEETLSATSPSSEIEPSSPITEPVPASPTKVDKDAKTLPDVPSSHFYGDHCYSLPPPIVKQERADDRESTSEKAKEKSAIDSVIESVVQGNTIVPHEPIAVVKNRTIVDHEYTRTCTPPPQPEIKPKVKKASQKQKKDVMKHKEFVFAEPVQQPTEFFKRNIYEEMAVLYDFLKTGVDAEDVQFLKRSYDMMLQVIFWGCFVVLGNVL